MRALPSIILVAAFFCSKTLAIVPDGRFGGSCTLIDKRIYYFGGAVGAKDDSSVQASNDLFILDIEKSITSMRWANSLWNLAPNSGDIKPDPSYFYAMAGMLAEKAIMIYGGISGSVDMQRPAIMYDITNSVWKEYENPVPELKQMAMGSLFRGDNKQAYYFGGRSALVENSVFPPFSNIMHIYNFALGTWSDGATLPNDTSIRYLSTVALYGSGLYYFGGMTAEYSTTAIVRDNLMVQFNEVLIFNTTTGTWRKEIATGTVPSNRILHEIANKPDSDFLVLYGGQFNRQSGPIGDNGDECYSFNKMTMTWTKHKLLGEGPGPLYGHTMVFPAASEYLIVMFGVNKTGQLSNRIHLLDTNSWTWVDAYRSKYPGGDDDPITTGPPDADSSSTSNSADSSNDVGLSGGAIAGVVVGIVAGVGIFVGALLLCVRRRRNMKRQANYTGEKPTEMILETRALKSFEPVHSDIASSTYQPNMRNDKEHFYTDLSVKSDENAPAHTSTRSDIPMLSHAIKADGAIIMTPEKPDGASSILKDNNIRPVKPDGI